MRNASRDRGPCHRAPDGQRPGLWATALLLASVLLVTAPASATTDVREAIVKVYAVKNRPDYDNPWNRLGPETQTGSGAILTGHRIVTNAHIVGDQTFVQVRRHSQAHKVTAQVVAVAHDADLALLSVADTRFFDGVTPLRLGALPHVQDAVTVYGFPIGGDTLSTTTGVISRIEHRRYAHSGLNLLAAQLDAAINAGNSGGPVLVGEHLVGIVMQGMDAADNIGYMVPTPVVQHVLSDIHDGDYGGFPELGIHTQPLDNASLKQLMQVPTAQTGVLITQVVPGASAQGHLVAGDILTEISGQAIGDDGTVVLRPGERTHFANLVQRYQVGERLTADVIRAGVSRTVQIPLKTVLGSSALVLAWRYDRRPSYFIYGGLVFSPLTLDYLYTWGDEWYDDAPAELLNLYQHGVRNVPDEEVVLVIKVLASELNAGYGAWVNQRITTVNGQPIRNLRELVERVEQHEDAFTRFETSQHQVLVIDRNQAAATHQHLLQTYDIPRDRSPDLGSSRREEGLQLSSGH